MPTRTKPTTLTQDAVLTVSAARRYGHVLPLPEGADATAPKAAKLLKAMLAAGLIEEHPTSSARNAWRSDEQGKHLLLRVTETGRQAVDTAPGVEADQAAANPPKLVPASADDKAAEPPRGPGGKLGQVLAAVQTGEGASLGDLVALTGWLPHTVRASLTRLRQGGVPIELTHSEGQKRYVAGASSAPAQ